MRKGGLFSSKKTTKTWWVIGLVSGIILLAVLLGVVLALQNVEYNNTVSFLLVIFGLLLACMAIVSVAGTSIREGNKLEKSRQGEAIEHERVLTIVNNLADSVYSTDRKGIIRIYNASGLNLLDTNQDINGKHIDEVMKLYDTDNQPVELFKLISSATVVTTDENLSLKFGDDDIRLGLTYAPIRSSFSATNITGTEDGYIIIARDITKLKSLEEERDEFISVVSHELRTPITVAEGTISNLQLMVDRSIADKTKLTDGLKGAHDQVMFLAHMINDLSTLSRAERGVAGEIEEIDVAELAHSLHTEYSPEAEENNLHLNLELAPRLGSVHTSRLYLHELLQNFITNSIKYTKEGSVTLKITKHDGKVIFSVSDTGIGISKSDQAKVFGKFYRSEDYRTRETGGTGLGLYVSAKLAKKLDTRIELNSRLNHGSTFSISLPQAKKS